MDRRVRITLPEPLVRVLERMADEADEPVARIAAQLVRDQLDQLSADGRRMPARRQAIPGSRHSERPPWLEPYGGDPNWRRQMWGEIVALCGRYPAQLRGLQEGWWNDAAHLEHVCALICWRQLLDDSARDPVEELSFQLHIAELGATSLGSRAVSRRHGLLARPRTTGSDMRRTAKSSRRVEA
jgi:hypothetical protein